MDIIDAIKTRRSIRGYKPDPVPRKIIREILEIATRSPSSSNTQPWEIVVATGKPLDELKRINVQKFESGAPISLDIPLRPHEGKYKQRHFDNGVQMYTSMGIAREDKPARIEWNKRGFRFFDAPVAVFLMQENHLAEDRRPQFDMGLLAQTICLTAMKYGLGTCIQGQGVFWPDEVRRVLGLPENKRFVICISLGYPLPDFPPNKVIMPREPVDNITTWAGF